MQSPSPVGSAGGAVAPTRPTRKPLAASKPQHAMMAAMDAMHNGAISNKTNTNGDAATTAANNTHAAAANGTGASGGSAAAAAAAAAAAPTAASAASTDAPAAAKAPAKRAKKAAAAKAKALATAPTPAPTTPTTSAPAAASSPTVTLTLAQQQQRSSTAPPPATALAGLPPSVAASKAAPPAAGAVRLSSSPLPLCLPSDHRAHPPTPSSSVASAAAFADLFVSFVRDASRPPSGSASASAAQRHFYVLEIGSASNFGKSAYQFLVALAGRVRELPFATVAAASHSSVVGASPLSSLSSLSSCFTFVLSDPSQTALDNLRAHPQLQPLFDMGVLDLARFDPARPQPVAATAAPAAKGPKAGAGAAAPAAPEPAIELYLQNSSQLLCSLDTHTSMFVLCNEQMNSAPPTGAPAAAASASGKSRAPASVSCPFKFDAFRFDPATPAAAASSSSSSSAASSGTLHEWLVGVTPAQSSVYPGVEWSSRPVADVASYYPAQPALNAVLGSYVARLGQAQFPAAASLQPIYVDSLPRKDPAAVAPAAASSSLAPSFQTFTFPVTACELMVSLRRFARGPLLLAVCERGFAELVTLPNQRPSLGFGRQGKAFSAGVAAAASSSSAPLSMVPPNLLNLHALSLLATELGGYSLAQAHRSVSSLRVTAFGFAAARAAGDEEDDDSAPVVPLPAARTTSPVKSVLKAHGPPPPPPAAVAEPIAEPETANGAEESNGTAAAAAANGSKKRVKFTGLTYKEQKALKRAEQARLQQLQLQAQTQATGASARVRTVQAPHSVSASFQSQFSAQSPLDVPGLVSLCLSAHPAPSIAAATATAPSSSSSPLSLAQALSVLSLSHYELDAWARLKPLFSSGVPRDHVAGKPAANKGTSKSSSTKSGVLQPYHLQSPMEHDIFLAFQRVWSSFFALPSDIYGALPHSANTDLAFELASYYCVRRRYRAAIAFYTRSVEWFGAHPVTLFNLALCHVYLRSYTAAREHLRASLALDAVYPSALQWLQWVDTQVGGQDEQPAPVIDHDALDPFGEQPGEAVDDEEQNEEEEPATQQTQTQTQTPGPTQAQANGKPAAAATSGASVSAQSSALAAAAAASAVTSTATVTAAAPTATTPAPAGSPAAIAEVAAMRLAALERKKAKIAARKLLSDQRKAAEAAARAAHVNGTAPAVPPVVAPVIVASPAAATVAASPLGAYPKHSPTGSWAELEDDGDLGPVAPLAALSLHHQPQPPTPHPSARMRAKTPQHHNNARVQPATTNTAAPASNGVAAAKPAQPAQSASNGHGSGHGAVDRFARPASSPAALTPSAAQPSHTNSAAPKAAHRKQPKQQQQQQQQQPSPSQSGPPRAQWQSGPAPAASQ